MSTYPMNIDLDADRRDLRRLETSLWWAMRAAGGDVGLDPDTGHIRDLPAYEPKIGKRPNDYFLKVADIPDVIGLWQVTVSSNFAERQEWVANQLTWTISKPFRRRWRSLKMGFSVPASKFVTLSRMWYLSRSSLIALAHYVEALCTVE